LTFSPIREDTGAFPAYAYFEIPDTGIIGDVLDGQHRILGLERSSNIEDFDVPVVLMFDLSSDDKAFVFSIINSKQTPVSGSLIYDLFDLSKYRSPQKTCHYIAQALNSSPESPFYRRLKMLGRREEHHDGASRIMLTQGSFAARLQELISKDPMEDARRIKADENLEDDSRCPLRKYFKEKDDSSLLKIVGNYFSAVSLVFHEEWNDETGGSIIRKTVGYTALVIVFRHLLEEAFQEKNLTKEYFASKFNEMKKNLGESTLTANNFPSSGAGAIKLAKALLGKNQLKYNVIEAPDVNDVMLDN
jgi:DGQHR domain-containing protein